MKKRILYFILRYLKSTNNQDFSHLKNRISANFNDHIGLEIQANEFYESFYLQNLIKYFNKKIFSNTMLDIGSNIGNHSVFFSNYFHKIISFEPQKTTYKLLRINTEGIPNISTFNHGISSNNCTEEIYINSKNRGMISKLKLDESYFRESCDFKSFESEDKISYVKIDVEGNEVDVLKALKGIIKKNLPVISFEFNDPKTKENIGDLLFSYGYKNFYVFNHELKSNLITKIFSNNSTNLKKVKIDKSKNYGMVFTFSDKSEYKLNDF